MFGAPVRLIVALPAEADPLRERFDLKRRTSESAFPLFENRNVCLIVSGVGKLAAAAATGYLLARDTDKEPAVWMNIGVAGHATMPVGEAMIACEVLDEATGQAWRPFVSANLPFPVARVTTVDRPPEEYPDGRAVDMEAAGFCSAAHKNVPDELAHCVKVVSDNRMSGTERITSAIVSGLIAGQLETILITLERLADIAHKLPQCKPSPELLGRYTDRFSLSRADRNRLSGLLSRWKLVEPSSDLWLEAFDGSLEGKELLRRLDRHLMQFSERTAE